MAHSANTQNQKVLNHLRTHRCITSMQAFELYGITRLSARIADLREEHVIKTTMITKKNQDGHICNYAEYSLEN